MADVDPFVSTEDEVEVDSETAAAIRRGIQDDDTGRTVSAEEVRELLPKWKEKYGTQKPQ
jgi:predicted transcriptional regulator